MPITLIKFANACIYISSQGYNFQIRAPGEDWIVLDPLVPDYTVSDPTGQNGFGSLGRLDTGAMMGRCCFCFCFCFWWCNGGGGATRSLPRLTASINLSQPW